MNKEKMIEALNGYEQYNLMEIAAITETNKAIDCMRYSINNDNSAIAAYNVSSMMSTLTGLSASKSGALAIIFKSILEALTEEEGS